jgi:phenylacetate-coenzyme A ligase PaaK-like adenylate-forming protein
MTGGNRLDALFDSACPGPEPRGLRLARWRAGRLAATLELAAEGSAHYRRSAKAAFLEAAARLRAGPPGLGGGPSGLGAGPRPDGLKAGLQDGPQNHLQDHSQDRPQDRPQNHFQARPLDGPGDAGAAEPARRAWEALAAGVLAGLPFTTEDQIAAWPEGFLAVAQDEVEGVVTVPTSGSRGPSKRIFSSAEDLRSTVDFFRHGMLHLVAPGQRVALLMGGGRPGSVGALLTEALAAWPVGVLVAGLAPSPLTEAWLERLRAWRPDCLVGLPSQLIYLCRTAGPMPGLKTVLLSGEPAPKSLRLALEAGWGARVFVHYGLTELGLAGAVECPERRGPHLREAELMAEIASPDGAVLGTDRPGELVLTSLARRAMPLVRYRTGDLAVLRGAPCPCGSAMRTIEVLGRIRDLVDLGGRRIGWGDLGEALYGLPMVLGFEAALRRGGPRTGAGGPAPARPEGAGPEGTGPEGTGPDGTRPEGAGSEGTGDAAAGRHLEVSVGVAPDADPGGALAAVEAALKALLAGDLPVRASLAPADRVPASGGAKPILARD